VSANCWSQQPDQPSLFSSLSKASVGGRSCDLIDSILRQCFIGLFLQVFVLGGSVVCSVRGNIVAELGSKIGQVNSSI